jgi:polyferredoxin
MPVPDTGSSAIARPWFVRADRAAHALGDWLLRHQSAVQAVQWCVVGVYRVLVAVPALLPLPDRAAHLWTNLTLSAQFAFWGVWWPFVLLSMVLVAECGVAFSVRRERSPSLLADTD